MKTMIHETLEKVITRFKLEIEDTCLCTLKTIRYNQGYSPDYTKKEIQNLYLLRYYPAYLCEYKFLYKDILRTKKVDKLSILAVGCGCCVDYHGAFLAKGRDFSEISYSGIDLIEWDCLDSFGNPNFNIIINDIKNVEFPKKNNYNVIMFPKSISEFDDESFESFLNALMKSKFTQDIVFLVSSVMNKGFIFDSKRYEKVVEFLKGIGYVCKNYNPTQEIKTKGGLNQLDSQFDYPNDIKDYIISLSNCCKKFKTSKTNCYFDCKTQLNKWSILRTEYISFQINCFERII